MKPPSYYWDTNVFLTVLTGSKAYGEVPLRAAEEILRQVEKSEAVLISSDIITAEILPLPDKGARMAYDAFEALRMWPNVIIRSVDYAVLREAASLRSKCRASKPSVTLATPDAIHLATARIYKVTAPGLAVHSFDGDFGKVDRVLGGVLCVGVPSLPFTGSLFGEEGK